MVDPSETMVLECTTGSLRINPVPAFEDVYAATSTAAYHRTSLLLAHEATDEEPQVPEAEGYRRAWELGNDLLRLMHDPEADLHVTVSDLVAMRDATAGTRVDNDGMDAAARVWGVALDAIESRTKDAARQAATHPNEDPEYDAWESDEWTAEIWRAGGDIYTASRDQPTRANPPE